MLVYIEPLSIFPELHSDTIFGGIISAISQLYPGDLDELLEKFEKNPPFILSSAFPFIFNDNNEKIRFYPKIISNINNNRNIVSKQDRNISNQEKYTMYQNELDNQKKFKKVEFIQEDIFFDLASGKLNESDIISDIKNYNIKGSLLGFKDLKIVGSYKDSVIPNNTINRITSETVPFYSEGREFSNMGLFFIIEFKDETYKPIVKSSIKFLKDRGFGKDISTGKGHFNYKIDDDFEKYDFSKLVGDYFITLSRFIPNMIDIENIDENSFYELGSKRGRSFTGELRKEVRFFEEGSTFPNYNETYGQIVNSGKLSPSVEYGYAFPMSYNKVGD